MVVCLTLFVSITLNGSLQLALKYTYNLTLHTNSSAQLREAIQNPQPTVLSAGKIASSYLLHSCSTNQNANQEASSPPNSILNLVTQTLRFDAAYPGTLPVLNQSAVSQALLWSHAIQATIQPTSRFDRKHYL